MLNHNMFRSLIALAVAFAIAIAGFVKPAYAYSGNSDVMPGNYNTEIRGNNNTVNFKDSFNNNNRGTVDPFDSFSKGFMDGAATTIGITIGGVVVCYTVNGIAATVFPPAAALAAFCPALGAVSGGATAAAGGVKAVAGIH